MNPVNKKRWLPRIAFAAFFAGLGVVLSLGVLITWVETYSDAVDPKNIYYVLCKHGLNNNMNIDSALVAMSHDVRPVRQVQGLTREQLKNRFGYTRTLDEATPYLAAATQPREPLGKWRREARGRTWRSCATALGWCHRKRKSR
jgi:hypothetical protein